MIKFQTVTLMNDFWKELDELLHIEDTHEWKDLRRFMTSAMQMKTAHVEQLQNYLVHLQTWRNDWRQEMLRKHKTMKAELKLIASRISEYQQRREERVVKMQPMTELAYLCLKDYKECQYLHDYLKILKELLEKM
jgi:hypothetical protein